MSMSVTSISVKIGLSSIVVEVHSIKSENHPNSLALIRDDGSPRLANFSTELGSDGRAKSLVVFSSETAILEVVVVIAIIVVAAAANDAIVFIFVLVLLLTHDVVVVVRWLC